MSDWKPFGCVAVSTTVFAYMGPRWATPLASSGLVASILITLVLGSGWAWYDRKIGSVEEVQRDEVISVLATLTSAFFLLLSMAILLMFVAQSSATFSAAFYSLHKRIPVSPQVLSAGVVVSSIFAGTVRSPTRHLFRWACMCGMFTWVGSRLGGGTLTKSVMAWVQVLAAIPVAQVCCMSILQIQQPSLKPSLEAS